MWRTLKGTESTSTSDSDLTKRSRPQRPEPGLRVRRLYARGRDERRLFQLEGEIENLIELAATQGTNDRVALAIGDREREVAEIKSRLARRRIPLGSEALESKVRRSLSDLGNMFRSSPEDARKALGALLGENPASGLRKTQRRASRSSAKGCCVSVVPGTRLDRNTAATGMQLRSISRSGWSYSCWNDARTKSLPQSPQKRFINAPCGQADACRQDDFAFWQGTGGSTLRSRSSIHGLTRRAATRQFSFMRARAVALRQPHPRASLPPRRAESTGAVVVGRWTLG